MKIGSSVWYGHRPLAKKFGELLDAGFEYFEISLDYPFPEKGDEIKEALHDFGIQPAFHASLDILLACPRDEIFRSSMKVLEKCLNFAAKFETLYFNFHATHLTPTLLFPEIGKIGLKNIETACKFAVEYGRDAGFMFALKMIAFSVKNSSKAALCSLSMLDILRLRNFGGVETTWIQ